MNRRGCYILKRACSHSTAIKSCHPHPTSYTTQFQIFSPSSNLPTYRVMDEEGKLLIENYDKKLDSELLLKMYRNMILAYEYDEVFVQLQRQGRISFYMMNSGEYASQVGPAEGLHKDDLIYISYRQLAVFLSRGVPLQELADHNFQNKDDPHQGKQLACHYGSTEKNIVTISSPLATQMPQAVGAAYAFKREKRQQVVACFFGDGGASEGDGHVALMFSSTLKVPMIWLCHNNGYAISTPIKDQYAGDGLTGRALGMGIKAIRVDGNDMLATLEAVREARKYAIENCCPVLIEMMTYRLNAHSTSDDSSAYRDMSEVAVWSTTNNPLIRARNLLKSHNILTDSEEEEIIKTSRSQVRKVIQIAEKKQKPPIQFIFDEVYSQPKPWNLVEQEESLRNHLRKYTHDYGLQEYEGNFFG